jgi:acetyl esterase
MALHPQAAHAIQMAGDLPTNLTPIELRRVYTEQRVKMLAPAPAVTVIKDFSVPSASTSIPARFYCNRAKATGLPLLVFYHGGGWMLGSIDSYDTTCRRLAVMGHCAVMSIGYRLAPETPFPGAVEDAYTATLWCAQNAARLGIDPEKLVVCGDSAGGNLAAVVAQMSLDSKQFCVALQILIYPATDLSREWPSYERNASGYMLTSAALRWLRDSYAPDPRCRTDERASPMLRANLEGLPRALIISAEYDPLVDDNKAYADRLTAAGVATRYVCFAGMIHPFFTLGGFIDDAQRAEELICSELRALA